MAVVTVRYWASARAAAGVAEERCDGGSLADVLTMAGRRHGEELRVILARCSFLVDDAPVGAREHGAVSLSDGDTVEVLPPFAGG